MLQQKIEQKRRLAVLRKRLNRLRLRYFDHEDAGKATKHQRLVTKLLKAISKVQ
jgi:hypothetical protein